MNPKEYYYNRFYQQFESWIKKTATHEHPNEGVFVFVRDLKTENLQHIPKEDYMFFHCALAGTILIDQVMYTHFKEDYLAFQQMTLYPKIELGLTGINVRPWAITHSGVGLTTLENFFEFFVSDLKEFFTKNKFKNVTWDAVKLAMLADKDVVSDARGEILKKILEKN